MRRRTFIKNTTLATAAVVCIKTNTQQKPKGIHYENSLPEWRGFNLRDFNSLDPKHAGKKTTEEHLKWMGDWGFDFIRLPLAYPYYLEFDRTKDITPDEVYQINEAAVHEIEHLVYLANKHGLHVSLNLHRAPGYCINAGFHEPYNLWKDKEAREAFYFHWNFWAKRFKNAPEKDVSFDLLNEPCMREDMNDQHSVITKVPDDLYRQVIRNVAGAIRSENKDRLIIADGNNVGNDPIPGLDDLRIAQSCRGYYPHAISHYKAPWASADPDGMPVPVYPGKIGSQLYNRPVLENYYQPWMDLLQSGTGVHCGECGSWNKTPHAVVLAWFRDVSDILSSHKIGFALWEFIGDFGILNSGRTDVDYANWYGYQLDKKLLQLIQKK